MTSAHAGLGVVLDVRHVANDGLAAAARDQRLEFREAAGIRGELRLQVGDVLIRVARGPGAGREQRAQLVLAELPIVEQQEVVDQHAFLVDRAGGRRHRARRDAADVGVVGARGDEERGLRFVLRRIRDSRR